MDFADYQRQALRSDQVSSGANRIIVPLLGLAGEAGTLLSEYKKYLRDGSANVWHKDHVAEELGDLLWYIANLASKYDLDLGVIAEGNLAKARGRWIHRGRGADLGPAPEFDAGFPAGERLPRQFEVEITETREDGAIWVRGMIAGQQVGAPLTDNAYAGDGYRFHDVFHLAYAAVLGWSPVTRSLLKRKRKSDPTVDEVEDGGRAIAIEEGLSAIIFSYAQEHALLEGVRALDEPLLKLITRVTAPLEVARCAPGEWETAVLTGFDVWRALVARGGGRVRLDLDARAIALVGA